MRASGGRRSTSALDERLDVGPAALDLDEHALGVVPDLAGQVELVRQAVHERPEPDALDDAGHPDPVPDDALGRGHHGHRLSAPFRPSVTAASRCMRPKL